MPTSVRLDPATERLLERLAKNREQSRSQVIREAIAALAEAEEASTPVRPADAVRDLLGCYRSGQPGLSERTGEHFRTLLEQPRRDRR